MSNPSRTDLTTPSQRERFADDGVIKVSGLLDDPWLEALGEYAERELSNRENLGIDTNPGASRDRSFTSRNNWRREPVLQRIITESPVPRCAAELMGATRVRLYFDHLLVKEPATAHPTPWHQDIPYWPFLGRQICSVWVSLSHASIRESSLEFVRASHLANTYYAPTTFSDEPSWMNDFDGEPCPDIDADRDAYDIIGFDVEPGDAIVFSAWMLHGAPGNAGDRRRAAVSTRWLGDDVTWAPHAGSDPIVGPEHVSLEPGDRVDDDRHDHRDVFPIGWPRPD
jgi:ectoine hydroxylase-related dioxygenase (phytanoyl-CoA dioxygenase family)